MQMGWLVWKVNGVSLEGMNFKGAMAHIANVERPLSVLFKTPVLEGDAAKEVAGAIASPSVAVNETKRRLYKRDAASAGGLRVAEVVTSSRNLMSVDTPTKDLKVEEAALRAEISKIHTTALHPATVLAPAAGAGLDSAPGLNLGAPPARIEVDAVDVATSSAAAEASTTETVTGGRQTQTSVAAALPSETAQQPLVAAGSGSNKMAPDLFTFDSPAPAGAPRTAAAAQALAAQLFASPAVAPAAKQDDDADINKAEALAPAQAPPSASKLVDSKAVAVARSNPFATGTVAVTASPKEAVVEQKKRLYAYDAASGGITCASVATECRNLLAGGLTPLKGDAVCPDWSSSSPALNTNYDSGTGPYEMVVWRKTATGKTQMCVSAKSATGDLATIADLKDALLTQTLAAHQGLLKAPLRIVEVTPVSSACCSEQRTELGDELRLKVVFDRQANGKTTLMAENIAKPTASVAAEASTTETVTGGRQTQTSVAAALPSETAQQPLVAAGSGSNKMAPDLFTFDSPAPAGAPRTAAAAQALAAQLFASPAVAPAAKQDDDADINKAERITHEIGLCQTTRAPDWVSFDTPVK